MLPIIILLNKPGVDDLMSVVYLSKKFWCL